MKQILQSLKTGATEVAEVPVPRASRGFLLIQTSQTLVSAGTERMLVAFGKAGWIDKARQQPDKVRMVLDKIKTDGLQPTLEAVFNKLDQPLPLGYCNVGRVAEVGTGVTGFAVGDRVISNGKHAEVVSVPLNLCAKVPDAVSDEEAAFTVLGAIALQGIRLVQPTLGEAVVVTGLGLIGLMTVQLLRANGCRVLGLDFDPAKLAMARQFGAEVVDLSAGQDPVAAAETFSRGRGVDAVIVTAATQSSEPMHQAALMCRKRGRIVLVGVTGLTLSRDDFFKKELTFQVSASYGPGRYDPSYEEKGQDYPVGFVRWTEQRNFEAVLDLMAMGQLDVRPLISHRFDISEAEKAYELVGGAGPSLGILLTYPGVAIDAAARTVVFGSGAGAGADRERPSLALGPGFPGGATEGEAHSGPSSRHCGPLPCLSGREAGIQAREGNVRACQTPAVSFVGAGNYATAVLIPAFKAAGADLRSVASSAGVSGVHAGRKFGFAETTTESDRLFADASTAAVVITTRHDSHARFVLQGLRAGKAVFVEKPLCLTLGELGEIAGVVSTVVPAGTPGPGARDGERVGQAEAAMPDSALPSMALDSGLPAGMTGPSGRDGERVGQTEAAMPDSASPSVALDSGFLAGMTEERAEMARKGAGMTPPLLMVGFNRRFAPHVQQMKQLLAGVSGPKAFVMTVNAGAIPADHWTQDPEVGGGRVIGEACHFIDLLRFLAGVPIVSHARLAMDSPTGDTLSLQLGFADGSIGTVHYFANGSKAFPKERLEVFAGGRVLQLDNFRSLTGYGWPGFKSMKLWRQDKGQKACAAAFVQALRTGGAPPIPLEEILEVSRVTIEVAGEAS